MQLRASFICFAMLVVSVSLTHQPAQDRYSSGRGASHQGSSQSDDSLVARGKERYAYYKCYECHGKNGEGTYDAPDLTHSRLTAEQISAFLQKPSADADAKGMPAIPASSPDLQPLVAYVVSLSQAQSPAAVAQVAAGSKIVFDVASVRPHQSPR